MRAVVMTETNGLKLVYFLMRGVLGSRLRDLCTCMTDPDADLTYSDAIADNFRARLSESSSSPKSYILSNLRIIFKLLAYPLFLSSSKTSLTASCRISFSSTNPSSHFISSSWVFTRGEPDELLIIFSIILIILSLKKGCSSSLRDRRVIASTNFKACLDPSLEMLKC